MYDMEEELKAESSLLDLYAAFLISPRMMDLPLPLQLSSLAAIRRGYVLTRKVRTSGEFENVANVAQTATSQTKQRRSPPLVHAILGIARERHNARSTLDIHKP